MNPLNLDENHLQYCDKPHETAKLRAYLAEGTAMKAAQVLGVDRRNVDRSLQKIKARAEMAGYSPEHDLVHPVPNTHYAKGVSTCYDGEGNIRQQWVKSDVKAQQTIVALSEAVEGFKSEIPKASKVKAPKHTESDLVTQYTITDYHLGMYAWGEECGDNWDTDHAEDLLVKWFASALELSPNSERAVFAQIGDFLHWDGMEAVTPASKHVLDADTRFQHLVRVAIRVIRRCIEMMLAKHKHVHVIMADANHDPASGAWLREMLYAFYEKEPRVTVDASADTYYCYEFGVNALFYHHGHKRKPENIDTVFAAKFREVFGRTKHAYAHLGHFHNRKVLETNLMLVTQHRTLAAKDAYASRGGWMSGRDARVITYHREFGQVGELTISPDMV